VRESIDRAAAAAGRSPESVRLVAVTKGHPPEAARAALSAGLHDLGENRIEELDRKIAALGRAGLTWHMIGTVQSRKAKAAIELADVIHSVDSIKLAERLARAAAQDAAQGREDPVSILVQVNTSGEEAKQGLAFDGAEEEVLRIVDQPGLVVEGLMTMAPLTDDERVLSATFARLRELRERLRRHTPRMGEQLSMGMTNDLAVAIREGSTMVRIGTALFGERS
jgi:pyridoxal phosphate enzyme (YggS family)